MEVSEWHFAQKFEAIRQRAHRLGIERQGLFNDRSAPFVEWTGNTKYLDWMTDATKEPPLDFLNVQRAKPLEEFFCWLMLPKDFHSKQWYFGRVYTPYRSLISEIAEFRAIAAEAGKLLRRDSLFRAYLSPCVAHIEFAAHFPAFHDHLNESYWCALLFTRPTLSHPIRFPFKKSIVGEEIGVASIANPFKLTAQVIARWRLNSDNPIVAEDCVARPYRWVEAMSKGGNQTGGKRGSKQSKVNWRRPERPRGSDATLVAPNTQKLQAEKLTIRVNVDAIQATISGKNNQLKKIDLPSKQVARWLKVLCKHPRRWIPASELKMFDKELDGARTSVLSRSLRKCDRCSDLVELIETSNKHGARFNPDIVATRNGASRRTIKR